MKTAYGIPSKLNPFKLGNKETPILLQVVFAAILVLLSLDFGFIQFKSRLISVLVKTFCAVQTLTIYCIYIYYVIYKFPAPEYLQLYLIFIYLKHCILVFVLLISNKSTLFDFYCGLLSIDQQFGLDVSSKYKSLSITLIIFSIIIRSFIALATCVCHTFCSHNVILSLLFFHVPLFSGEIVITACFIIYYILYYHIKNFTGIVSNGSFDVVSSQYFYKYIADIAESIRPVYNSLYAVLLACFTIDIMWNIIAYIFVDDTNLPNDIFKALSVIQLSIVLFSPAFAAGLLSSQVDQLRVVLQNRLLQETNKKRTQDIERFGRYIEARPFRITIWSVIPLDWQLPVIIINICVTYLIVVLQFTNRF